MSNDNVKCKMFLMSLRAALVLKTAKQSLVRKKNQHTEKMLINKINFFWRDLFLTW